MKSNDLSKKFPANPSEWAAVLANAPGEDRPLTPSEAQQWREAVVVQGGGYQAARQAVAARRKPGERGAQLRPTKQLVSVRYSPEVIEHFKAGGLGWQTRMNDALMQWVAGHKG